MAYFLPSYFQKRLLRYALSRLDFIDSDALDLDNLGFTIGQRSVVELKDVAIRVSKVVEKVKLPAALELQRSSIRLLRITIPADLHASGIEIEVDGLDIDLTFDPRATQDEKRTSEKRNAPGPTSHRDVANRPRIPSTGAHDPGGRETMSRNREATKSPVLPVAEDLVASFLQTEPEREIQDLQTAVASASFSMPHSSVSLDGSVSEDGMGNPEGFSLPAFLTNFFTGIADRLSVTIKRITVRTTTPLDGDYGATDTINLVLRIEEVEVQGLGTSNADPVRPAQHRVIRVAGIELLLVSDTEIFAPKSYTNSPRLSKSRSSASDASRQAAADPSRLDKTTESSSSGSFTSSNQDMLSQSIHESMLETSQLFDLTSYHSLYTDKSESLESTRLSPTVSREAGAQTPPPQDSNSARSTTRDTDGSGSITPDNDQSMYMSFMSAHSTSERMPGGFDDAPGAESSISTRESASSTPTLHSGPQAIQYVKPAWSAQNSEPIPSPHLGQASETAKPMADSISTGPQYEKRCLRINDITLKIPGKPSASPHLTDSQPIHASQRAPINRTRNVSATQYLPTSSHIRTTSDQSVYGISKDQPVQLDHGNNFEIIIGDIELTIDISICHLLAKVASPLLRRPNASLVEVAPPSTPVAQTDIQLKGSIHSVIINLMEHVPERSSVKDRPLPTSSTFSVTSDEAALLQFQLLNAQLQVASTSDVLDWRFSVHRLSLYREADKIITFFDPASLQESFVAASVTLEPDDIVIRQLQDRVDITLKPIHVMLDLLLLDDVLSKSGGLSSLLDLGNSVASANTTRDLRTPAVSRPQRRRSVHFNDSLDESPSIVASKPGLKLNIRISTALLDLVGSKSSLQIRTSAIKVAQRPSKMKVSISSVSVKGPIVRGSASAEILSIKLGAVGLTYIETPEEEDLDRLLQLLAPSSDQQNQQDDDIMVDTLLRQRRKGGVLRISVQDVQLQAYGLAWIQRFAKLGEEISKLSSVTKYLPEDDRPGMLTFALVNKLTVRLDLDHKFGPLILKANLFEAAHISVPSLMAAQLSSLKLVRGSDQPLIRELIPNAQETTIMGPPMIMSRFIPDEMEPTVKLKFSDICFEYSVPLFLAITQLVESLQSSLKQDIAPVSPRSSEASSMTSESSDVTRKIKLSINLRNTAVSLKPSGSPAYALFVLTDTLALYSTRHGLTLINVEMRKASFMIIDDIGNVGRGGNGPDVKFYFDQTDQVQELVKDGFVPVASISAAVIEIKIMEDKSTKSSHTEVELRNNLVVLETCADSTQTLIQILSNLSPPTPPSKVEKYRMEIVPIQDMLDSWTGNPYVAENGPELGLQVDEEDNTPTPSTILVPDAQHELGGILEGEDGEEEEEDLMHNMYASQVEDDFEHDPMTESGLLSSSMHSSAFGRSLHVAPVSMTAEEKPSTAGNIMMHSLIDFRDDHFVQNTTVGGTAHRWNSKQDTYAMAGETSVQESPLKVKIRDVHIIWNMFDGYDWQYTRDAISQAVHDVETKAIAKQRRKESNRSGGADAEDESVVGDVLFNSIYINIPSNRDPRDLANAINFDLGDVASETGSYATSTTITASNSKRNTSQTFRSKKLKLKRSKSHKLTFELEGLAADFLAFPKDSGEIESSIDIRVRKLEIFDHIPTSRWRKFATYMHESGEREIGTDMVHIEVLNVKPVADLAASEMVLKLTVLPLRLYVDQDALDFMTRFFEFKDDRTVVNETPSAPPFIQRAEVNPIRIRLDFKPKRVDYAGLKSGKLTEFMNFIVLERSDLVLRRVILYGVSGLDRLGIMLNSIWTPDVRNNQLPGVLAGLAPIRPLVDVGSGVRDLIAIPIREYKKDGRIVRSIQKGALAFAKTTTTELVNLGAKLAIGTQTVLQNAETLLAPHTASQTGFGPDSDDEDHQKEISNYADQPLGIIQGLRGAYASLERDLLLAKDAIVAVPGEIIADGSATGAAKIVLKQSPTIILRPAIGVTKAVGQAFLGAGNTLDKNNRRRIEDKYKRY